ncbi:hypothetical protein L573_2009 [Bordetella holmesii H620]|nr:hypothetical protein L573_2009 [Bordetella holmesii H620]
MNIALRIDGAVFTATPAAAAAIAPIAGRGRFVCGFRRGGACDVGLSFDVACLAGFVALLVAFAARFGALGLVAESIAALLFRTAAATDIALFLAFAVWGATVPVAIGAMAIATALLAIVAALAAVTTGTALGLFGGLFYGLSRFIAS